MSRSKAQFTVFYDGEALQDNQMDVRELAPALLAIGDILNRANTVLNGPETDISVKVKAFKSGCFGITLAMVQDAIKTFLDLLGPGSRIRDALEILGLLGFTVKDIFVYGGIGVFALIKFSKGKLPKKRVEHENGNVTLTFERDGMDEDTTVARDVDKLFGDFELRESIGKSIEPLDRAGIDSFGIEKDGERKILVTQEDRFYFLPPVPEPEPIPIEETPQERVLAITSLSFKEGNKWRLSDGSAILNVQIDDKAFLKQVDEGLPFAKGDMLKILLLAKPVYGKDGLKTEYIATKVLKVIRRPSQFMLIEE